MSKPANKKVIGLFVLGAISLLVLALVIFGSGKIFKKTFPIVFYFEGSVKGLNVGSDVVFRGVKVGSVTGVELLYNPKDLSTEIRVVAEFDPESIVRIDKSERVRQSSPRDRVQYFRRLIDKGLRAQLQMQSVLTGQLMINLDFIPGAPLRLVSKNPEEVEIPTIPTTIEELAQKLSKIPVAETFEKMSEAIQGVADMMNSPEVQGGVKSLSQSAQDLEKLIKSVRAEIQPLSASIQETMKETRTFIANVDRRVGPLASRMEGTLDATQKLVSEVSGEVAPVASDLKKTLEEARTAMAQAQKTLQRAEGNYGKNSAFYYDLTETLAGLNEASRSISLLGEYLKRHPDAVLWGKGKPGGK